MWNQKGSNFNTAWTWAKTTTNTEAPISESSKHTPTLCRRLLIFLAWLFQDVQSTGTAPNDCSNLTSSFTTELTSKSYYSTHRWAQVFYRNRMREIQARTVIVMAVHSTVCFSGVPPNTNWILNNCPPNSHFESHLAAEAATQPVMVSSFRY